MSVQASTKASEIKRLQEEALDKLPLGSLYVVLWLRADPPLKDDFHWELYLHTNPRKGIKYDIKNIGGGWITDHGPTGGVLKSFCLCVLIQIAIVPEEVHETLDRILRSYDGDLSKISGVTCRVWAMTVVEKLIEQGIVRCSDPGSLEQEFKTLGNQYAQTAAENEQPRPIVKSQLCL